MDYFLDYACGVDSTGKNRIGMNSDPSNKTLYSYVQTQSYCRFPAGNKNDRQFLLEIKMIGSFS